jgi:hypothetical protein
MDLSETAPNVSWTSAIKARINLTWLANSAMKTDCSAKQQM